MNFKKIVIAALDNGYTIQSEDVITPGDFLVKGESIIIESKEQVLEWINDKLFKVNRCQTLY